MHQRVFAIAYKNYKPTSTVVTVSYCVKVSSSLAVAAAKKAVNDERERELNLEQQAKIQSMEDTSAILKKAKLSPEEAAEKGRLAPTADLASQIREAQAEVVRVSKISSNLQGPLQRTLRVAASLTMASQTS